MFPEWCSLLSAEPEHSNVLLVPYIVPAGQTSPPTVDRSQSTPSQDSPSVVFCPGRESRFFCSLSAVSRPTCPDWDSLLCAETEHGNVFRVPYSVPAEQASPSTWPECEDEYGESAAPSLPERPLSSSSSSSSRSRSWCARVRPRLRWPSSRTFWLPRTLRVVTASLSRSWPPLHTTPRGTLSSLLLLRAAPLPPSPHCCPRRWSCCCGNTANGGSSTGSSMIPPGTVGFSTIIIIGCCGPVRIRLFLLVVVLFFLCACGWPWLTTSVAVTVTVVAAGSAGWCWDTFTAIFPSKAAMILFCFLVEMRTLF